MKKNSSLFVQLYNSIKVFLICGKLFNIVPYTIESPNAYKSQANSRKSKRFSDISCLTVLQFIISTFVICSVSISTHFQHTEFDTTMGFLTRLLYMGEYFFGIVNMILIMYGCLYQRKRYTKYLIKLSEIDKLFSKCNIKLNFKFINNYFKFYLIVYGVFFLSVLIVDFMYNRYIAKSFFRSSTVYTIPNIVSILGLTQYSGILYYIRKKYIHLNNYLRKISHNKILNTKLSIIHTKQLANVVGTLVKDKINKDDYSSVLNTFRIIHSDLNDLCKEINESFGLLIISTLITSFVVLSIQLYAIYKTVEGYSPDDLFLTIYTILWIVLHGGKIFIILLASDGVIHEVKNYFILL